MDTVTVKTKSLLYEVTKNRKEHRANFLKAQEGYRKQVIEELDRMLDDARTGKPIRRAIELPEPEDHTKDYDRVIAMLEMSVDTEVILGSMEFDNYVLDNWSWKAFTAHVNAMYTK